MINNEIFENIGKDINDLDLDKFLVNKKYYCHKLPNQFYIFYFGVTLRSMIG
jgi:hypothetical protein